MLRYWTANVRLGAGVRRNALYHALLGILKLYAAYVPHITAYLCQSFFRQYENTVSIHLLRRKRPGTIDANLLAYGTERKQAVPAMRRYKPQPVHEGGDRISLRLGQYRPV